ncbi:BLUF domain-containing protein [Mucilaginibacter agri]|uniref:BLUF domain-containing protein n=1 Tax=Mucilaginibacter agri TaxID=2695265 RepID=A0A965ZJG8_9SPHI|nr:BLUF domain-containing protein [Mucilaginibacter agri]NCD70801.1 hypothetical protein [Mucilaginibacter agri]
MKYLIYMSSAVKPMSDDQLLDILTVSRERNAVKNITGMLLYGEGAFVQVLEGEADAVEEIYESIKADLRHKRLIEVSKGDLRIRNFPDWWMGFRTINNDVVSQFKGFINVKKDGFQANDEMHPALIVLRTFADTSNLLR